MLHVRLKAYLHVGCSGFISVDAEWHAVQLIWGVIRGIWLSAFITIVVGLLFLATSVRETICNQVADHIEYAGHALSGIAAHLMPIEPACDPPSMHR